jgi:aminopeptidase-like protein|tara:strand:- start:255 stop:980 length:726 start_codon:yes stop_codon:yes gene_type:complete
MANNELSGPIVSMALIDYFRKKKLNKTLKFIFIPETIGSITYLYKNLEKLKFNIVGGYNLSCIGDERNYSCMFTKYGNTISDYSLISAYKKLKIKYLVYSFLERGSDERQYNSPGIDLPIASIFRSKYGTFPEYHTSLDNFNLVTKRGLRGGFNVAKEAISILDKKVIPINNILCEPQMGRRGMFPQLSTKKNKVNTMNYLNFLQYSDGKNDINKISILLNLSKKKTIKIYQVLKEKKLVR